MRHPSKFPLKICFTLALLLNAIVVQAITPVAIKKETPKYILDIKYPQGFQSTEVNTVIKNFVDKAQKEFMKDLYEDANTPASVPGKTSLNVTYSVPYETKNALSVRFNVSINHRGAAHPSNLVAVENFIAGHSVKLADLFESGADYLKPIAAYCKQAITAKKISDEKWLNQGTSPSAKNYEVWTFNKKGIDIIFNNYQVAAYVYGEQTVTIPLDTLSSMLKPKLSETVWGN